jgi:hypothetical protein
VHDVPLLVRRPARNAREREEGWNKGKKKKKERKNKGGKHSPPAKGERDMLHSTAASAHRCAIAGREYKPASRG